MQHFISMQRLSQAHITGCCASEHLPPMVKIIHTAKFDLNTNGQIIHTARFDLNTDRQIIHSQI